MKNKLICLTVLLSFVYVTTSQDSRPPNEIAGGYKLGRDPTYLILAPQRIYPNEVIQVSVSILKLYHDHINVRASIRSGGEEYASFFDTFTMASTRVIQMRMRENAQPGNYTLRVEGTVNGGNSGAVFVNETDLIFDIKQVSIFIQTNKPIYKQGQDVLFRVIPVMPNQMPVHGSMDIYALDPTGTIVRRWLSQQTNAGILEMNLQLADQVTYGTWKIMINAYGANYEKTFEVEEFFVPRFYVNVSMPLYIMEDTFALAGLVTANHTSGRPARGDGVVTLEIRDPLKTLDPKKKYNWPTIKKEISYFEGRTSFLFTLSEVKDLIGEAPTGKELFVSANISDWFLTVSESGFATCIIHSRQITMKLLGDEARVFKPGFPVHVFYALYQEDGTPLYGRRRQVTIERIEQTQTGYTKSKGEQKMIVRDDGIVHYTFVAGADAEFIRIRAFYDNEARSKLVECTLYKVYSPTDNYISITTSTEKPVVDEYMVFTVKTTMHVQTLYYVIVAGGNIVVANLIEMSSRQKTFSVALSRDMVPSARIVAYYVWNGEIIADSLNFFVNGSTLNPVEVRVNMGKDFSRNTIEVTGLGDPVSYIAFSGLDYDLYAAGGNTFLTQEDIIEEMETYDSHANQSFSHTWYYEDGTSEKVFFPSPSYGVDTNTTFSFSGLIVFTDANVTRIPFPCNETKGELPCMSDGCYFVEQRCDTVRQCVDGADEMGCKFTEESPFTPRMKRFKHTTHHFLQDGKWLWKGHFTKPDGRIDLRATVPDVPMSWTIGALSMSPTKGLGVTKYPTRHQSTRQFYIEVEMPELVIKGEQIGVRVALFNYWDVDMECLVTLHDSDDYRFIIVEDFGIVSSYKPRTTRGDIQTMVYVQSGKMMTIFMPVIPVTSTRKTLDVVLSATSFMGSDVVKKSVSVIFDGVTNYYNTPYLIDLVSQGSIIIPDFDIPVPERFIKPDQREHLYVPGSPRAFVSLVGDVVGPGFFEPVLNAENLMRLPYGCGEQNMFNFAANLYYLKFLKITNQLSTDVAQKALHGMNLDLQRQLSYMNREDGSFSMFRDYREPKPSTWLTAFVLKTLQNADEADWRNILFIESDLLNKIAGWLCEQHDRATGAFFDRAPVYDYKMKSNKTRGANGEELYHNLTLTAHVLIALHTATGVSGPARTCVEGAKTLATAYLERNLYYMKDPHQIAIVAYALAFVSSNKRNDAFNILDKIKRTGSFTYWANKDIPVNPTRIINTVPFQQPRIVYDNEASAVEATSYALMVYLLNNRLTDAIPAMKWLQTMRNSLSGFASTQDSIVALEALTEFGRRDTNRDLYNMRIKLEATSTSDFLEYVNLNNSNFAQLQNIEIPQVWGQVKAVAQGTGMALMQMRTEVNVEYPYQQYPQPQENFYYLEREYLLFHGRNFSIMDMTVCTRWLRPDLRDTTGMTVIEVGLPTGYVIMNDDLRNYTQSGVVPNLGRAYSYDRKVVFYLDYVSASAKTCVTFRATRWFPIANATIQHILKVYDYYEPGMFKLSLYTAYDLFNLHICQVCGSFQCPYCPFYNTATTGGISLFVTFVLGVVAIFATKWIISETT